MRKMYEIFVPCQYNTGKPVRTRHHKEWDKYVRRITGGLTIYRPAIGQWIDGPTLYDERVIPVRFACDEKHINKIMKFTMQHYKQLAVLAYVVSEEVLYVTLEKH